MENLDVEALELGLTFSTRLINLVFEKVSRITVILRHCDCYDPLNG